MDSTTPLTTDSHRRTDPTVPLQCGLCEKSDCMAYGVLSGVEAINGLYAGFFPVLIYSCLGTSRHASVGTFAVTSLMTAGIVKNIGSKIVAQANHTEATAENGAATLDMIPLDIRLQVMIAVTLAVGLWQVLMGVLRLGYFLAVFLSDHLVKGFTCAAAFHIFTSQVKLVFGIGRLEEHHGPLKLVYFYVDFFRIIRETHIPTLIVSLICITLLYLARLLINGNPRVMKIIKVPFPMELLVIIFGTLASYELNLESKWGVIIVKNIPTGLPVPVIPPYSIMPQILGRTFSLAIVASAVLISLAKIFATKNNYKIDSNQELIALGASNIFGSFFLCIVVTGGLGRTAIQESAGGSTQMVSLVSVIVVLIVLVALGKFLQPLPRACLGAIVMVALIGLLTGVLEVKKLWKVSLIDASIFMVSLLATLLLDVDYGLAIGVLYSLVVFAFRMQYGRVAVLGRVRGTLDEIKPLKDPMVDEVPGIKIFRLHGPLYSGNAESFVSEIRKAMPSNEKVLPICSVLNPEMESTHVINTTTATADQHSSGNDYADITMTTRRPVINIVQNNSPPVLSAGLQLAIQPMRGIIIDCSAINFIDVVGSEKLLRLVNECNKKGIRVVFSACSSSVRDVLYLSGVAAVLQEENFSNSVSNAINRL
ncbi:Solute carrier family 26 member 6 [Hypsibius exemplaris]|uniref:Solute carrier family 26 member 6 n=1 Tax=Hypsibius exemplaris TaxID=2072580 RepID=A0A1W0WGF0_HYPEX|nr:Solute carrier family 26 member 6 [Hypsibius exemplaris]